jgi:hypothetical protein
MNSSPVPAVIISHPGHELRVHHWLEQAKPAVCVLTDGSGHTQRSRLDSTTGVLSGAGAVAGPVYGRFTDADMYAAVRRADHVIFTKLADELADWLVAGGFTEVAGDALEWYNTSHDVCRYLIAAAAEIARRRTGRELTLWQFLLVGPPDSCPAELRAQARWVRLDDVALQRKLAAAEGYPELAAEVAVVKQKFGVAPFTIECLQPTTAVAGFAAEPAGKPYYEEYGEKQVAAGHYADVIRYREHVQPLRDRLRAHAGLA